MAGGTPTTPLAPPRGSPRRGGSWACDRLRVRLPARIGGAVLIAVVTLLASACGGGGDGARATASDGGRGNGAPPVRDVVLVTIDTWRHDAAGFTGSGRVLTPAIDAVAAGAAIFPNAHAHAVVTLPSHASILTGLLPYEHGVRDNAGYVLDAGVPTIATVLRDAGFATGAFVSAYPLDRRFGLDVGFETYDDAYEGYGRGTFTFPERPGDRTVDRALDWWRASEGRPRFLWVHVFTPHFPYAPHAPFDAVDPDEPYWGDVAMTDAELAPLFEALGVAGPDAALAPRTAVVLTSDHGESLGEHGELTHGLFAYESTLRVPLVIRAPGVVPGPDERYARHVDIAPTLLELAGVAAPGGLTGRSLLGAGGETGDVGDGTYFEALTAWLNRDWAPLHGRIEDGVKAIDLPVPELYDLREDPTERHNRVAERGAAFRDRLRRIPPEARGAGERGTVDDEAAARLRSLGYVAAAGSGSDRAYDETDDPKRLVDVENRMLDALTRYRAGHVRDAIATLRAIVAEHPRMTVAHGHLAFVLSDVGRVDEAIDVLLAALASGLTDETLVRKLALNLLRVGRTNEAMDVASGLSESLDPETQVALGRIAAALGREAEAEARFDRALELDATFPEAAIDRGILRLMQDRVADAERSITDGLSRDPDHAEGWNALGVARARLGDAPGALEAWRRAIEVDPRLPDALFNYAMACGSSGRFPEARDALERYRDLVDGPERERAVRLLAELPAG